MDRAGARPLLLMIYLWYTLLVVAALLVAPLGTSAGCVPKCPMLLPEEICDFTFEGHLIDVPILKIDRGGDVPISPKIVDLKGNKVEVDQTGPGVLECVESKPPFHPSQIPGQPPFSTGNQFYATGGGEAKVYARTFQSDPGVRAYANRCVVLPLLNLQAASTGGSYVNLSPGDGNAQYKEERRCVVFRTWSL